MSNSARRAEAKRARKSAVRAAVEQQFGMKPGTLKPPEVYVSVGWRLPLQKAPAYNRVGHPRCYW